MHDLVRRGPLVAGRGRVDGRVRRVVERFVVEQRLRVVRVDVEGQVPDEDAVLGRRLRRRRRRRRGAEGRRVRERDLELRDLVLERREPPRVLVPHVVDLLPQRRDDDLLLLHDVEDELEHALHVLRGAAEGQPDGLGQAVAQAAAAIDVDGRLRDFGRRVGLRRLLLRSLLRRRRLLRRRVRRCRFLRRVGLLHQGLP